MKDHELKPCPFCGGEAHEEGQHVYCSECGVMPCIFDETKDSLVAHRVLWNTRSSERRLSERKLMAWIATKYNVTPHQAMVYAQDMLNQINSGELWE